MNVILIFFALRILENVNSFVRMMQGVPSGVYSSSLILPFGIRSSPPCAIHPQSRGAKPHSSVVGRFGTLVNDLGEAERLAGKTINRTFDDRLVSDYDPEPEDLQSRVARIKADGLHSSGLASSCAVPGPNDPVAALIVAA